MVCRDDNYFEPKHSIFLSHSGAQKSFVKQLCMNMIDLHFLTNAGTTCQLDVIYQGQSSKQLNNVKLQWWFCQRNSFQEQSSQC
jgi:hypothetical protein